MTPQEIKQQVREELMNMQVQINTHRDGDAFIREYTLNDAQLDSLIDRTVQMTEEKIVGVIKEDQKKYEGMPHDIVHDKLISLITNKSEANK